MTKQIILIASITLAMTGCAQKKLNTTVDTSAVTSGANGTNTGAYTNVDPMGQGMSQGNGTYAQNSGYGNGAYGNDDVKNIYFDSNQYNITSSKLSEISHNANLLRTSAKVKIEGHCDASGTDEYNYALGLRRAKATKDAMVANGISANKMTLVSMGESSPECETSSSADCYAKNRRVEFKVMQ